MPYISGRTPIKLMDERTSYIERSMEITQKEDGFLRREERLDRCGSMQVVSLT